MTGAPLEHIKVQDSLGPARGKVAFQLLGVWDYSQVARAFRLRGRDKVDQRLPVTTEEHQGAIRQIADIFSLPDASQFG